MNSMTQNTNKSTSSYTRLAKSTVTGTLTGIFIIIILLFISAFIISGFITDTDKSMNTFILVSSSTGALVGGGVSASKNGTKGLLCGLFTGVSMSLLLFLLTIIFNGGDMGNDIMFRLLNIVFQVAFACGGGVFAINHKKDKKISRRK